MMFKPPSNNIRTLRQKRGISSLQLARMIGTSAPHMSRLINGQSPLTMKWTLKIAAAFNVPTTQITGVTKERSGAPSCDDTLLGSIMGWMLEASHATKTPLSRGDLAKLTSFVYKESVDCRLDFKETKYLAVASVKIKNLLTKKRSRA